MYEKEKGDDKAQMKKQFPATGQTDTLIIQFYPRSLSFSLENHFTLDKPFFS